MYTYLSVYNINYTSRTLVKHEFKLYFIVILIVHIIQFKNIKKTED